MPPPTRHRKQVPKYTPELKMGDTPIWHHHHSSKMAVKGTNIMGTSLTLEGSAASLYICPNPNLNGEWLLTWSVQQSLKEKTVGTVAFTTADLQQAFGLVAENREHTEDHSLWLLERYGGSVAYQGHYIRYRKYLNIPCPGTGHDGDPNISIMLDLDIKDAIGKLLSGTL